MFYKLKGLREAGYDIILHTYYYGNRTPQPVLEEICSKVHYYERATGWRSQFSKEPYIVASRKNIDLLENLCKDDHPILFEGLHTCGFLSHPRLAKRRKIVRTHNIEHDYYGSLAAQAGMSWRALFYRIESEKLRRFEGVLSHADVICAITEADREYLSSRFPGKEIIHLPCFFDTSHLSPGQDANEVETEPFVLYHGNLGVEENQRVMHYICEEIAPRCQEVQFVIAGRNPGPVQAPKNVRIVADPDGEELDRMVERAHIHLMLTFQNTGIKLKLLNCLTKGSGHIIANSDMLHGHTLGRFCTHADSADQIADSVKTLMGKKADGGMVTERRKALSKMKEESIDILARLAPE